MAAAHVSPSEAMALHLLMFPWRCRRLRAAMGASWRPGAWLGELEGSMPILMPQPDASALARRKEIVAALRTIVPGEGVIDDEDCLRPYETDGLTAYRQLPLAVVLPETTEQIARILEWCHRNRVKVVPRGAGTSLSGGAL